MTKIRLDTQVQWVAPAGSTIDADLYKYSIVPSVKNLVTNNSFETDLSGWTAFNPWASITRVTNETYTWTASMKVDVTSTPQAWAKYTISWVTIGKTYTLSCYVKWNNGLPFWIYAGWWFNEITLNWTWQRNQRTIVATATTLDFLAILNTTNATFYIDAVQVEEWVTQATTFTTTQWNLTVALKNYLWQTITTKYPIKSQIWDTIRTITSDLSLTLTAWTNYFNLWSSELATKEADIFTYLVYDTALSQVWLIISRIPWAKVFWDFSSSGTNEKWMATSQNVNPASTDPVVNIGRFSAILSAGAWYTWSTPSAWFQVINYPIFESKSLSFNPIISASWSMTYTVSSIDLAKYKIQWKNIYTELLLDWTTGGTASYQLQATMPFSSINYCNFWWVTNDGGWILASPWAIWASSNLLSMRRYDWSNYWLWTSRTMKANFFYSI